MALLYSGNNHHLKVQVFPKRVQMSRTFTMDGCYMYLGPHLASMGSFSCVIASFPGLCCFWLHKERGGPGIFSHVCDVKGRKVVERTSLSMGALRFRTTRRANVPGNLHVPQLSS